MSVIREIKNWTLTQPDWVADATRRLFSKNELDDRDIADLVALAKQGHGIKDPDGRIAIKLDADQDPPAKVGVKNIRLVEISDLENVNAISTDGRISFNPNGLNIIYGYNGAGKSGYTRILKKACSARNTEEILPNVFSTDGPVLPAQAKFKWLVADLNNEGVWVNSDVAPADLSRIAVFDSHCARVFIDDKSDVAYIPYGLDILSSLATVMGRVQEILENEQKSIRLDLTQLASLKGETAVGRLIDSLNHLTRTEDVVSLAFLTEEEEAELAFLRKLLGAEDPGKQAVSLRRFIVRLETLKVELARITEPFLDQNISKLRLLFSDLMSIDRLLKVTSNALLESGNALAGTGSDLWEKLLHQAISFASSEVHPTHAYPDERVGSKCVLCQQPLQPEAKDRLSRFAEYLETDNKKKFDVKREEAAILFRSIKDSCPENFPADKVIMGELNELFPALAISLQVHITELNSRKSSILISAKDKKVEEFLPLSNNANEHLALLIQTKTDEALKLERVLSPDERKLKIRALAEFEDRLKLKELLPSAVTAIEVSKTKFALGGAIKGCNTIDLTRKINQLHQQTVTIALQEALAHELKQLGMSEKFISLELSGQRGSRMQQLRLPSSSEFSRSKLSGILSEGEQRAIALASFLAEIGLYEDESAIVFDDPISSLDHIRREKIAERLSKEAKKRQVIVFTHDLAFAWSLKDCAARFGAIYSEKFIYSSKEKKGLSTDTLPFDGKKIPERIEQLFNLAKKAKESLEVDSDISTCDDQISLGYQRLRDTWELLVEDLLFNSTVKRFRRSIETLRLKGVSVEGDDVKQIFAAMTRCSNFIHNGGEEAPLLMPSPDEFIADIEKLKEMNSLLLNRRKFLERQREKEGVGLQ